MPLLAIEIVPAERVHASYVACRLRAADEAEARAMSASEPAIALRKTMGLSLEAWAGIAGGEPVCIFGLGIGSLGGGVGRPWLMGTPALEANAIAFLRRNRAMVRHWLGLCSTLENWVDDRHAVSMRWLRWLGFTLDDPAPFGPYRLPFRRFHQEAA